MSDKRIHSIVISAVMLIRADTMYGPRLMNCWLPVEIWEEALQNMGHIDAGLAFNAAKLMQPLQGHMNLDQQFRGLMVPTTVASPVSPINTDTSTN